MVVTTDMQTQQKPASLVRVDGLTKLYPISKGVLSRQRSHVHAVDGVDFEVRRGESYGLVGESGSGKTTTGRLLVRLTDPTSGTILFRDENAAPTDIATLKGRALKRFRRRAQMIFQDPYESMNTRRTILDTIAEPLKVQKVGGSIERLERVSELLELVGLTPPNTYLFRYPHELSGG